MQKTVLVPYVHLPRAHHNRHVLTSTVDVFGTAHCDEKVTIPGFLTFERTHRAARTARNPQTGEPIEIPAGFSVKVSAGTKLKDAAKGK